jgi:hypothetical protein
MLLSAMQASSRVPADVSVKTAVGQTLQATNAVYFSDLCWLHDAHARGTAGCSRLTSDPTSWSSWASHHVACTTTESGHVVHCCRSRALQDRIRLLEQQLQQQEQRLKGYIPQTQVVPHVEANAPDGTLLYRLENLEMGMDVLLRAQELQWQESAKEGKKKARSCCCCVM